MSPVNTEREKTIVLVTNQFRCERLIRAGKTLSMLYGTELVVFCVQSSHFPQNPLALEHLYNVSKAGGAVMNIAYSDEPQKKIISFLKHQRVKNVISGNPESADSLLHKIWRKFTHINFFTVDEAGSAHEVVLVSDALLEAQPDSAPVGNTL